MTQGLSHWDTADLKFFGDGILAKLFAFAQFAAEDLFPKPLQDRCCEGLPGNWGGFSRRQSLGHFRQWIPRAILIVSIAQFLKLQLVPNRKLAHSRPVARLYQ